MVMRMRTITIIAIANIYPVLTVGHVLGCVLYRLSGNPPNHPMRQKLIFNPPVYR